jgi:hypothetical protein
MKHTPPPTPEAPENSKPGPASFTGLAAWLRDDRFDAFLGRAAVVKLAVLAELVAGNDRQPAATIAQRFGITRAAVGIHVRSARKIFGFPKPKKTTGKKTLPQLT